MISPISIIGSLVYRACEALNANTVFMEALKQYPFYENCVSDGHFNLWHYPGTFSEISATLIEIGTSPKGALIKFPSVLDFQAVKQRHEERISYTYNLAIAGTTDSEWTTEQRDSVVFELLLRPVYEEFIRQAKQAEYLDMGYNAPIHDVWEVFSTGNSEGVVLKTYGEHVDAIELPNLTLRLRKEAECRWGDIIKTEQEQVRQRMNNLIKTRP